jgi:hypothetical protein
MRVSAGRAPQTRMNPTGRYRCGAHDEQGDPGYLSPNRFANHAGAMAHELAMNPEWFAVSPPVEVLQTLAHEMVHLWQHVHGKPGRALPQHAVG